jgi:hypothetical protein
MAVRESKWIFGKASSTKPRTELVTAETARNHPFNHSEPGVKCQMIVPWSKEGGREAEKVPHPEHANGQIGV